MHLLASASGQRGEDLAVVLYTVLFAGWVVLPVLSFSSDDLLDPAKLALLPLTRRQLLTVMGIGALVGVAPTATAVAALGLVPATATGPVSGLVAVLSAALLLGLCVTASRAVTAALSGLLRSRRGRDLGVLLAALVGLSAQLLNPVLQLTARHGGSPAGLHPLARVLRWGPPGLLATAPRRGPLGGLGVLLLVTAVLALLLVVWERSVRRALERVDASGTRRRRRSTALAPRLVPLPRGRVGAVAAKDLRYLAREPRRAVAVVFGLLVPVVPFVAGPLLLSSGPPSHALVFAVCGLALLSGLAGANRFGMDGSATWQLLASATDRRDAHRDLLGGDLASAVVCVPALLAVAVALAALTGGWSLLPAAAGLALALHLVSVGASGLLAVSVPVPVPQTANLFGGGGGSTGQGCAAGLVTLGAVTASAAACLPLLALLLPALRVGGPWGAVLLVVGPAYGLGVGEAVRRVAARRWARRGPEVLAVVSSART